MNRAFSVFEIKSLDEQKRTFHGVATTPSPDRVQDVVEPKGAVFRLPIPLLWQHDNKDPIGWVQKATVGDAGILVEGEIANVQEEGDLKRRLLSAWQSIKSGQPAGSRIIFLSLPTLEST
jgi:hypothetical protein